jgi:site-specific recombinase XerD
MTFLRWARTEGYELDPRILDLPRPRVPKPEADVYHMAQLRAILAACNPRVPQEEMAVRILVGSGVRVSELCGLALVGPEGLSDVMLDSLVRGWVELRVRWDGGAKGQKSRRVPITSKLAGAIKRYEARHRGDTPYGELLINEHGRPYRRYGLDGIMDRLQRRVGFRVHAHAYRHTFGTVTIKLGWSFEHLRAAMGHADYKELQRYVRLASERDLGACKDWLEVIVENPATDWSEPCARMLSICEQARPARAGPRSWACWPAPGSPLWRPSGRCSALASCSGTDRQRRTRIIEYAPKPALAFRRSGVLVAGTFERTALVGVNAAGAPLLAVAARRGRRPAHAPARAIAPGGGRCLSRPTRPGGDQPAFVRVDDRSSDPRLRRRAAARRAGPVRGRDRRGGGVGAGPARAPGTATSRCWAPSPPSAGVAGLAGHRRALATAPPRTRRLALHSSLAVTFTARPLSKQ